MTLTFLVAALTALAASSMSFSSMFTSDNSSPGYTQGTTYLKYCRWIERTPLRG